MNRIFVLILTLGGGITSPSVPQTAPAANLRTGQGYPSGYGGVAWMRGGAWDLLRCNSRRGDRAAAIRPCQTWPEVLREELGLSPAPERESVPADHRQGTLTSRPTKGCPPPKGGSPVWHELRRSFGESFGEWHLVFYVRIRLPRSQFLSDIGGAKLCDRCSGVTNGGFSRPGQPVDFG